MPRQRYLTKSVFKNAYTCETKLFYVNKPDKYPDQSLDDGFLQALAAGGFQVGELAKFRFCDDPYTAGITIDTADKAAALEETARRLHSTPVAVADRKFDFSGAGWAYKETLFTSARIQAPRGRPPSLPITPH